LLVFPSIVLAIILVSVVGGTVVALMVALVATELPVFARFLRSFTLQEREREYVQAAIAAGGTDFYILARVILPNIWTRSMVIIGLGASEVVLMIAALGYLGLGIQPPNPEWGAMLSQGQSYFSQDPTLMVFPGLTIMLFVLGANLTSQGLQKLTG
jgi:peptide/nickel transport system permease protein